MAYKREFERLEIEEDAIAIDESGQELGRVFRVSGGGFQIKPISEEAVSKLLAGQRVAITIVEPASGVRNVFPVEVVYREGDSVGVKFVRSSP